MENRRCRRRSEGAHLVKYVVSGQQTLGLNEFDGAVTQQRGGIHHRLSVSEAAGEGKPR